MFWRDILFIIPSILDEDKIGKQKQNEINKSNFTKNKHYLEYDYVISDKVLVYQDAYFRKLEGSFLGPYELIQIYTNRIVHIQRG